MYQVQWQCCYHYRKYSVGPGGASVVLPLAPVLHRTRVGLGPRQTQPGAARAGLQEPTKPIQAKSMQQ